MELGMEAKRTLTFGLMDPPYESARSTTALRLIDLAIQRGYDVNVFAYEGAVNLSFSKQAPHANAVHGRDVTEEDHPLPREWIAALYDAARKRGVKLDWVNCGLCVDERGAGEWIEGPRRGGPPDFVHFIEESDNTIVLPTGS
jgi:tRNA 2-thiouridine synthesizing protein D